MSVSVEELRKYHERLGRLKTNNTAANLVKSIAESMESDIFEGNIVIPSEQLSLRVQRKEQKNREVEEDSKQKMSRIIQKKEQILKQLSVIKNEEEKLRQQKMNKSKVSSGKYFKSELTEDDVERIKKLKAQEKKFEKQLALKTQRYEESLKKLKDEEQHQREKQKMERLKMKKIQLQKTIQLIEKRKNQRIGRLPQENKKLQDIINRRKLFEEWDEKWRAVQEQQEKKKQELKDDLRKLRMVTHEEIKQHEKKYQQTMKIQRQSRLKQFSPNNFSSTSCYRSVFLQQILEEDKKVRQFEELRKSVPQEFLTKIKQYGQRVKNNFKPTIKQESKQEKPSSTSPENRSMSLFQTHKKGNEYMRTVNFQVVEALKGRDPNIKTTQEVEKSPRYKNYLREVKRSEGEQGKKKGSQMEEIKSILMNKNLSQQEKLLQSKILTQKFESKQSKKSSQSLVSSINAKLQILKQIDI